jgi:hypothetical protein
MAECSRCGSPIACNPQGDCWCKELPPLAPADPAANCLCARCLWSAAALAYLRKHRDYVQRDLDTLRAGQVAIAEAGAAATARWIGRYERQLGHIDRLLQAHDQGEGGPPR